MVRWFRPQGDRKRRPVGPERERAKVAKPPPAASPLALFPREPNYSQLSSLQPVETTSAPPLAPLVVIGVGPVGQAVLETLANWLPVQSSNGSRSIRLLAVRLEGEPRPDFALPPIGETSLLTRERLELPYQRSGGRHSWYPSRMGDEWVRPDGRLGFFQDVQNEPSALWDTLQECLGDGSKPDVWLVSSGFDAVGSGMIFDLAHLTRLVGRAQQYEPFIGWMLALPGELWGEEHQPQAAATLRELARLLCHEIPRIYEYNPRSQNYTLHRHETSGREDANLVLLCEPPSVAAYEQAAESVVNQMALGLLALAQPAVWQKLCDELRIMAGERQDEKEALVSAFGACAHYVPLRELQELVRARLTQDVLTGRKWGAMRTWRRQMEPDEAGALLVLQQANHDFLRALAQAISRRGRSPHWPLAAGANRALALSLREYLQELADRPPPDNGLMACEALLEGMEGIFLSSRAPFDALQPLEELVSQARREMRNWLSWLPGATESSERTVADAQRQWERTLRRGAEGKWNWQSVLDATAAHGVYEALAEGTSDVRQDMRRHIRWAWVVEGDSLRLCLDTLFPGWNLETSRWRHPPDLQKWDALWSGAQRVVTALTREPGYWPSSLTEVGTTPPSDQETQEAASLTLAYDTSRAQAIRATRKMAFQISRDSQWLEHSWLPAGTETLKVASSSALLGLLLQLHHLIPLSALRSLADLRRRYSHRRQVADRLHVFEAEQLAAEIEVLAQETVPRRRRRKLSTACLGVRTVAALQWPKLVGLFVNAWLAGLVESVVADGAYRLLDSTSEGEAIERIPPLPGNHPLEALHAFVLPQERLSWAKELRLRSLIPDSTLLSAHDAPDRLTEIADWWESADARDVEWYLLVHGLMEKNRRSQ